MSIKTKSAFVTLTLLLSAGCETQQFVEPGSIPVTARPERLFLQQLRPDSVMVKWRGAGEQACYTRYENIQLFEKCMPAVHEPGVGGGHKYALLTGLRPETRYYYTVHGAGDPQQFFRTAPRTGTVPADGNIHIFVVGDSGTATEFRPARDGGPAVPMYPGEAAKVRDGLLVYNAGAGNEPVDLMLLLGDNAYPTGSDSQWQGAFFDIFPDIVNKTVVWPTIGNHEMGGDFVNLFGGVTVGGVSTSSDPASYDDLDESTVENGMPYLDIFSLPRGGEAGGTPSGTEQYYSFDYGIVHVVSLDSQLSARDAEQRGRMHDWLDRDLTANRLPWTVIIFHHPPYSRGSHNSDSAAVSRVLIDQPMVDMRVEFTSLFEKHGVDVILGGHSHSYERSWYLRSHTGDADTFDSHVHTILGEDGTPVSGRGDQVFQKHDGSGNKVVYVVAGSSGHVSLGRGKLDHPAHSTFPDGRHGLEKKGSVVLDINETELKAVFIDDAGTVQDQFRILQ